jgi:hypothetical protein
MSNYSKTTDFEAKDSLPTGDSGKIIRGAEFETEFDAISTAIATKADTAGPTFTGTLTFETISDGTIGVTAFVDEDNMASNSATLVPTQQSVKAYVDSQVTAQDLDFQADTGGALSIDLDSETLTFTGGTGVDTSGSGNAVTFAIDSTVATLTGTQTLTNKTLTSPDVNTPDIDGGTIDGTVIGGTTPAAVSATTVSATGNITVGGTVDGRDVATDGTKLDGIEASADVTDTANVTAAGALMDSELTSIASVKALNQGVATTDSPTFAAVTVNGNVEFDGLSGTGSVTVTDILDQDDMSGNSATALATQQSIKAYVDSQVATADTLSEVLANGNTTGGTDIAFGDNDKAIFGAGSDLQIYHDGSNSFIADVGTGDLKISASANLELNGANGETLAKGTEDGKFKLYQNNTLRLETTSTGIDVTGTAVADSYDIGTLGTLGSVATDRLFIATADGLGLQFDFDNSRIVPVGADGSTYNNNVSLGSSGLEFKNLLLSGNATVGGTVTTDGLTVDGATLLNNGTNSTHLTLTGTTNRGLTISTTNTGGQNDSGAIYDAQDTAGGGVGSHEFRVGGESKLLIAADGDISFYEDTGTTAKLFWDASAEALGIGTSSPSSVLTAISGASADETVLTVGNDYSTADAAGDASGLMFQLYRSYASSLNDAAFIKAEKEQAWDESADRDSALTFGTRSGGTEPTERMRIDSSGGVGIGTTSIATGTKLQVAGETRIYPASGTGVLRFGSGGVEKGKLSVDTSSNMTFETAGTERMRLDSTGNLRVGVGNTFEPTIQFTNSGRVVGNPGYSFKGDLDTGMFNPSTQGTIAFANNGSESMRIDSAGNLQLGNTTGSRRLNVFSDTDRFTMDLRNESGYNSGELSGIVFSGRYDSSNNVTDMASIGGGKENTTDGNFGGRLSFFTRPHNGSDTERMRIDSSGNVKIGDATTDVTSKLTVSGNASASLATFMYDGAAGTYFDIDCNAAGGSVNLKADARTGAYPPLLFTTGGSESMRLDASGNLLVGATTTTNLSDGTGNDGVQLNPSGTVAAARTSNVTAVFNRLSTDGEIVRFNKDGTTVGSIATVASNMYLGTGDTGLYFNAGDDTVMPINVSTASGRDAGISLGKSDTRFKDLHLSGTATTGDIYVGAGSATSPSVQMNDTNSGLFAPAGNTIAFSTSGGERMRLDSSGAVLIHPNNASRGLKITSTTTGTAGDTTTYDTIAAGFGRHIFKTDGTERVRIDQSGNLLVGTTSSSIYNDTSGNGIQLNGGSGQIVVAKQSSSASDPALWLNNTGVDGSIVTFAKDGTTVGSIGVELDRLFVGSDDSMIFFDAGSTNAIWPWTSTATSSGDAEIALATCWLGRHQQILTP